MSREIKFRMVYKTTGEIIGYTDAYRLLRYGDNVLPDYEKAILQGVSFEQYTGLKDKNGKEIYEGDIVRIMGYGTYEVFWRSWDSSFSLKAIDTDIEEHKILMLCEGWEGGYTIVGNVHENPELLGGEE